MDKILQTQLEILDDREKVQARTDFAKAQDKANELNETAIAYPKLSDTALFGLAGEIVRLIEPHTEADNAALLVQLLAGFGNLIDRTAYFMAGADFHYLKIFTVLVGATASGRKGSSWSEVRRVLVRADESFADCIRDGLSTGEGLIHHVRDAQYKKTPIKEKQVIVDYQDEMIDEGAKEKRAFIIESEFARVLKVAQREGNTLSSVLRQAWDSDSLRIMTKTPTAATNTQISIVGHITKPELRSTLAAADTTNGFANRFLWTCVKRSKYLPDGGNLQEADLNDVVRRLSQAIQFAKFTGEIRRDEEANALWHQVYKKLSDGHAGLVGSVTSRAPAQTLRLACIYALLDCSDVIRIEHLRAALALWQYCEDSAKYIFGDSLGNKLADDLFAVLQKTPGGMSRNDIREHYHRNRESAEIRQALELLIEVGRIESFTEKTAGRTREVFRVINYAINAVSPTFDTETDSYGVNGVNGVTQMEKYLDDEKEYFEI